MGLCKCPKRKVTNLFCFEHDVNVCEYCLVTDHERCIVQSYIQWLQDNDYNPICILCNKLLSEESTIRLVCYDVFHWSCLNEYALSLPSNTAPAGYQCPKCKECIFPQNKLATPVAEVLRNRLAETTWARIGLGQSLIDTGVDVSSNSNPMTEDESNGFVIVTKKQQNLLENTKNINKNLVHSKQSTLPDTSSKIDNFSQNRHVSARNEPQNQSFNINMNTDHDLAENKYKRRPILEWFKRFLRSRNLLQNRRLFKGRRTRYYCYLVIIATFAFVLLMMIISHLAPFKADNDPNLDPMNNPNIRIQ